MQGSEVAEIFARSRINLNILRNQHHLEKRPSGVVVRTFEAPGSGGFLLSTRASDATTLLSENEAYAYFSNSSECISHNKERQDILRRVYEIVDKNHCYLNREKDILEISMT